MDILANKEYVKDILTSTLAKEINHCRKTHGAVFYEDNLVESRYDEKVQQLCC
jgi:hypothetical protein